jgi:multiple sugar transport system substrate-binding protein
MLSPQIRIYIASAQMQREDWGLGIGDWGLGMGIRYGYNRISDSVGRAVEAVLLGESSPVEALTASQQRLDLIFD